MKNILKTVCVVAALFAAALPARAGGVLYVAADEAAALKIYNGYTGTFTAVIGTGGASNIMPFTVDGNANVIDGSGNTDTIAELSAAIRAVTNAAGQSKLIVDDSVSLGTDSTDGELLDGTYTALPNTWVTIPWDTSAALHHSVALSKAPQRIPGTQTDVGRVAVGGVVKSITGDLTGTGNATVAVYVDGSLKYGPITITSPKYELGAGGTNVANASVVLDLSPNIPFGKQSAVIVRATRATTMTTPNLTVTLGNEDYAP